MQIPQPNWTEWGSVVGMRSGHSFACYNLRAISLENSDNMAKHVTDKCESEGVIHKTILFRKNAEPSGSLDYKGECISG